MAFDQRPVPAFELETDEIAVPYHNGKYTCGDFKNKMNAWLKDHPTKRIINVNVVPSTRNGYIFEMVGIIFFVDAESTYMQVTNQ